MNKRFNFSIEKETAYVLAVIVLVVFGICIRGWWDTNHTASPSDAKLSSPHFTVLTPEINEAAFTIKFSFDEEPVRIFFMDEGQRIDVGAKEGIHALWEDNSEYTYTGEVWYEDGDKVKYSITVYKDYENSVLVFRPTRTFHTVTFETFVNDDGDWHWTSYFNDDIATITSKEGNALYETGSFENGEKRVDLIVFYKDGSQLPCSFVITPDQDSKDFTFSDQQGISEEPDHDIAWTLHKMAQFYKNYIDPHITYALESQRLAGNTQPTTNLWTSIDKFIANVTDAFMFAVDYVQLRWNQISPWVQADKLADMILMGDKPMAILFGFFVLGLKIQLTGAIIAAIVISIKYLRHNGVWSI